MSDEDLFYMPVRVRAAAITLEERASLPADLDTEPFIFEAEASNNNLDAYFTHMTDSTLRNYARDGAAGVQFLDSHDNYNLGYGRTFGGRFEEDSERKPVWKLVSRLGDSPAGLEFAAAPPEVLQRAILSVYTVPGIRFAGALTYASTDDFIRATRAGLVNDVSIGLRPGRFVCDVCGGNYADYRACNHLAGMIYAVGGQGERSVLATVAIEGAGLRELSAVYKGATPGAMLVKAERLAASGELEPEKIDLFEKRYLVDLPRRTVMAVPDLNGRGSADKDVGAPRPNGGDRVGDNLILDLVREALPDVEVADTAEPVEAVRLLAAELARLAPLAAEGEQYRADLVEAALAEGVRAYGSKFDQVTYRSTLEAAPLATIKRFTADWAEIAGKRFPGGRQTVDEKAARPEPERAAVVPDSHYAG